MLDIQFPQIICSVLSSTFSRHKGSLLVIRWVRYLGNKPTKTMKFSLGMGRLVHYLAGRWSWVIVSWIPPRSMLMTWVMEKGLFSLLCTEYPKTVCKHGRGQDYHSKWLWLSKEIWEKEISCKIMQSSTYYCAWAQSAVQNGEQLGG